VLADIVICTSLGVDPRKSLVATVWQVLLVQTPRDASLLEQVHNGRYILGNGSEWVTIETEIFSSDNGHVVWLRWVSDRNVVGQSDTLLGKELEVG